MRIEILKNKDTSLVIDDIGTTISEDGMLKDGYQKAIQALKRYTDQAKLIRDQLRDDKKSSSQINDILYQSPHNIIAFSGDRGTGKTSAMISFSEFLKNGATAKGRSGAKYKEYFEGMSNLVLSPIDPTMLEKDQNILNVVLSRLIYKAEERWDGNSYFHRSGQNLEKEKNDLIRKANDCMNGILAIKDKVEFKSLADLQRIGDSAVLKKNLYDLVNMVNAFCLGTDAAKSESSYLIIPIDDTDCQILKAHDVMEDMRRYLTIPNVVFLMATDAELLRHVFAQHYADAFATDIKLGILDSDDMEHYADKYLSKLVPVTNRIYLPVFEKILKEQSESLELGYYTDSERNTDRISNSSSEQRKQYRAEGKTEWIDFNFQAKVLNFIYKKTGIVFMEHSMYINNIIPTTMRGLAHLLNFLDSMEQVEEIDYNHKYSPKEFLDILTKRLDQLEKNLDLFEEYFMKEWVPAKVSVGMNEYLKEIDEQVPENLIRYAVDELPRFYDDIIEAERILPINWTYYDLMDLLGSLTGDLNMWFDNKYKHRNDYYNAFAVRTLITIKNNKQAVRIRRKKLKKIDPGKFKGSIKYDADNLSHLLLPVHEPMPDGEDTVHGPNREIVKLFVDCFLHFLQDDKYMNQLNMKSYCVHEMAWIISCNWDVQDELYKTFKDVLIEPRPRNTEAAWKKIINSVKARNCMMLQDVVDGSLKQFNVTSLNSELVDALQWDKSRLVQYAVKNKDR